MRIPRERLTLRLGILVWIAMCSACGGSGGGGSGGETAGNPLPHASGLAPAGALAGSASLVLTVDGNNFIASSSVEWNGVTLPTTYVSATQLSAQVPASDIASLGSASVSVTNPAPGGGTSGALAFTVGSAQSSGPNLVQFTTQQTIGNNGENQAVVQFNSKTAAGNAFWVAVTVSDYAGDQTISVSDTQGNTFTELDQENDPAPGEQTVAHFYAPHILGDTSTPDTITVTWGNDDYKGVLITEISGVSAAPLVGHHGNIQDALPEGTNNVTSGNIAVASGDTPALLLAVSMNASGGSSDTGGSGSGAPAAGTGLTQEAQFWDYGVNLATFETAAVTGSGTAALFSASDTDDYVTVAVVLR